MAVAYDAWSESHTGSVGSTSESSFSWSHTPSGTPKGVLVFVHQVQTGAGGGDYSTAVTYGGSSLTAVSGGAASKTSGEPGYVKAWYLGSSVPTGTQTIQVTRTNNTVIMWACAYTVTAGADTEVYTAGIVTQTSDSVELSEQNVNDGSPGTNSLRFASGHFGHGGIGAYPPPDPLVTNYVYAGANSVREGLIGFDAGANVSVSVHEATAGQGSRPVGYQVYAGNVDDCVAVFLAVREATGGGGVSVSGSDAITATDSGTASVAAYTPATDLRVAIHLEYGAVVVNNDLKADVVAEAGIRCWSGIDGGGPLDRVATTGTLTFTLDNSTSNSAGLLGYYTPGHANCRAGWGIGVFVEFNVVGATYGYIAYGAVASIEPTAGKWGERRVRVTVTDVIEDYAHFRLGGISAYTNVRADEALTTLHNTMTTRWPLGGGGLAFSVGSDLLPIVFDQGDSSGLTEITRLTLSEWGYFYFDRMTVPMFRSRHARETGNIFVAATFTESDIVAMEYAADTTDMINTARVNVYPRRLSPWYDELYRLNNPVAVQAGGTVTFTAPYRNPATGETCSGIDLQQPVRWGETPTGIGGDWRAINGPSEAEAGLDLSSTFDVSVSYESQQAVVTVENGGSVDGWLVYLRLQGIGVYTEDPVRCVETDATSVSAYGERVVDLDLHYQSNPEIGQRIAEAIVAAYKDPAARVRAITVIGDTDTLRTQVFTRKINDRIKLTSETMSGISNAEYVINGIEFQVLPSGHIAARWVLAPAPADRSVLTGTNPYWVLGSSEWADSTLGTSTRLAAF